MLTGLFQIEGQEYHACGHGGYQFLIEVLRRGMASTSLFNASTGIKTAIWFHRIASTSPVLVSLVPVVSMRAWDGFKPVLLMGDRPSDGNRAISKVVEWMQDRGSELLPATHPADQFLVSPDVLRQAVEAAQLYRTLMHLQLDPDLVVQEFMCKILSELTLFGRGVRRR